MIFLDLVRRSGRSLLSAKTRTLLTSFAIGVGAFALTLTLGASNGAQGYADQIIQDNFDPSELIVTNDDSLFEAADSSKPKVYDESFGSVTNASGASQQVKMLADTDLERLKQVDGVESVRPAVSVNLKYITRDGQKKYVSTAQAYSSYKPPELLAGTISLPIKSGTMILPEAFLESLGFKNATDAIGKPVRLAVQRQLDQSALLSSLSMSDTSALQAEGAAAQNAVEETFTVIAVTKKPSTLVQPGTALYLKMNQEDVGRLNDYATKDTANYHKYLTAYVKVKNGGTDTQALDATQAEIKKLGYGAQSVVDTQETITQVITVLQGIVGVFGVIAIIASVFGVVNTMYISVLQRTREIGLMKALGMHKGDINKLFLFEAALIGLLGGLIGAGLAVTAGTFLNPFISEQLGLGSLSLLIFRADQVVMLVAALIFIAIVAGLLPARKASKLDPIEALRTE